MDKEQYKALSHLARCILKYFRELPEKSEAEKALDKYLFTKHDLVDRIIGEKIISDFQKELDGKIGKEIVNG